MHIKFHRQQGRTFSRVASKALIRALLVSSLFVDWTLMAIDPLPDYIETASPEVQEEYLDWMGVQSIKEKLATGRRRHQRRMKKKAGITTETRKLAEMRRQSLAQLTGSTNSKQATNNPQTTTDSSVVLITFAIALLCLVGYRIREQRSPEELSA